jgi:hypothetical protein
VNLNKYKYLRGTLRQNNSQLGIINDGTWDLGNDWDPSNIFPSFVIPANAVGKRCIPAQSEAIVPAPHQRVSGSHFEDAVLGVLAVGWSDKGRRRNAKLRGGYVSIEIIIIGISNARRQLKSEAGKNLWRAFSIK